MIPTIESSIPARFIGGLESTLRRHGYALVTATTGFDQAVEAQHGRDLIGLGAEALVILYGGGPHPLPRALLALVQTSEAATAFPERAPDL